LYSEKEIKNIVSVAILSEIPEVLLPSDERRNKRRMVLGWTMATLVVSTILAGSYFSYLHN
jgi:hypothetical protein